MLECDKKIYNAYKYVVEHESGYLDDLLEHVDKEIVDMLANQGYINVGWYWTGRTWKVTKLGRKYYDVIK